ncbi:glycerate kinase [Hoylesella oralis ATCC 33269]|uniref:Glycerate kinase n=1 Tax=Hoylesella oralis ATCC 33269 TaxID=873533 RepID=E7RS85_9BACT|nr:glycerate kinase [Hoylesella oralis]EFZ36086.1 glycerate kinase [Hoylesella oralis ATCC 33269]EPH19440.1 glycerate kinase [Hoylesella oralis HGA0225]SHG05191.1 glycerate kinase [Hoylesella oralis]
MNIVLAIDSFKSCLTTVEAEVAAAEGAKQTVKDANVTAVPMSDGGDGMLEVFAHALHAKLVEVDVHDALMRSVRAKYAVTSDETAIIEAAQACGIALISPEERDAEHATSFGVGELINAAWYRGCRRFIVGLGGSATSDCGMGMLSALDTAISMESEPLDIVLASDVKNPLYGKNGAAFVYAMQKGATAEQVERLDMKARQFATESAKLLGRDLSMAQGAGAAGGLGYAFMQYLGAKMQSGAELLLRLTGFDTILQTADYVITGEGNADSQTLMGKLPSVILRHAKAAEVSIWLIAGSISDRERLLAAGFDRAESINPPNISLSEAMHPKTAKRNISTTVCRLLREEMVRMQNR